uniref:Glyco_trans_2-like domain-containing protein n=1 Tax=Rhabditophanes sp. KR3021 TaxID=114890 RepID=A0AC35TT27_9BILA
MNRSQLNGNTYSGPQFGDSLRIYELEEEKIIRRRRHYKYGIALILLVGCIYLMMDVMQIGYKEPLMDKETVNKVKKYVNEASPLLNKPRSCQDHFKADFVEHGTDEYQEVDLNFGDMCLTNSTLPDPEFAIAFVFDNYFNFKMLDSVLNLLYHKKHLYCIISNNNKMNSQDLANLYKMDQCLPNVFVVTKREEVDGHGLECLNLIRNKPWNYTILLDNEDVPIKRITQFPSILKLLNGSSDMNIKEVRQVNANILDHFTYDKLDIFKNESLNKLSNVSYQ